MKYFKAGRWRTYPHKFGGPDFATIQAFYDSADAVLPLKSANDSPGTIVLRHDVDYSLDHAMRFARWEAERGYRATYFILPAAWYASESSYWTNLHALQDMGHEVGVHNDTVALTYQPSEVDGCALPGGFLHKAAALLGDQVAELKRNGIEVNGTASHGNVLYREHGVHNSDLWAAGWRPQDFGLRYEAYHLHRFANYISDNHGKWQRPLELAGDQPTHVLSHPCHWDFGG